MLKWTTRPAMLLICAGSILATNLGCAAFVDKLLLESVSAPQQVAISNEAGVPIMLIPQPPGDPRDAIAIQPGGSAEISFRVKRQNKLKVVDYPIVELAKEKPFHWIDEEDVQPRGFLTVIPERDAPAILIRVNGKDVHCILELGDGWFGVPAPAKISVGIGNDPLKQWRIREPTASP